jgi:hypothetical protein
MSRRSLALALLVGALGYAGRAEAQGAGFGMGFSGGYVDIGGGDLADVRSGFGLTLDLLYRWRSGLSIGFGTELAWPGSDLGQVTEPALADFQFISVFFEPRYSFPLSGSGLSPFIAGRVSYARMNVNVFEPPEELPFKADSDGVEYGGLIGVEIWLTEAAALSVAGEVSGLSFGEVKLADPPTGIPEELGTGRKWGLLAGIRFLFL